MKACRGTSWTPGLVSNLTLLLLAATRGVAGEEADPLSPVRVVVASPLSASESLAHFQLAPDLKIELVAQEPQVIDPIAMRFDENGRLWVVEMGDYPHGPAEGETPQSRIKMLQDRDQDGLYETAHVFADQLLFVTGVQPWNGGLLVTMAGEVAFMSDSDGDGRADVRESLFRGFTQENPQLRANHPTLALDNHVYIANGLRGGSIVDARKPGEPPVSISGMDFRFDPRSRQFEAVSGVGQFGLTFDDSGNRFVCSNRNPLMHVVLEDRYLKRNPLVSVASVSGDVARSGAESRLYPISRAWTTSNLHAGQFTAACGATIYRGDGLPAEYLGNAFTCDPTGNLVHREIVEPAGVTFVSHAAREGVEFLASPDEWFRPVNLDVGPDGNLYVVDMYRAVIEHPQFVPEELKQRPDTRFGDDRGRIYRIVSARGTSIPQTPSLSAATSQTLVETLNHHNSWWRETAARLLLERQDRSVERSLNELARKGEAWTARIHALWALQGLDLLDVRTVSAALSDPDPRVRRQAVRLAEPFLVLGDSAQLREQLLSLAGDPSPAVAFQAALSLAPCSASEKEIRALSQLALASQGDRWVETAVAIASGSRPQFLLRTLISSARSTASHPFSDLVEDLAAMGGSSSDTQVRNETLAALVSDSDEAGSLTALRRVGVARFAQSLARRRVSLAAVASQLAEADQAGLERLFRQTVDAARDENLEPATRAQTVELLGYFEDSSAPLTSLALEERSQPVRTQAIRSLSRLAGLEPWQQLLHNFSAESPTVRSAIVDGVLSRADRTTLLLDEIEAGRIKIAELDSSSANRLLNSGNAEMQKRAQRLLAAAIPEDRRKVLEDYQQVLQLKDDPRRGREIFRKNCATCHRIADIGVDVAPDISDSRTKTPQQILTDVIQPNRAIDNNYISYSVITSDGRSLTGVLSSETTTSITLKQAEGKTATLLRSDIEEIRSNGVSLMPEGLEKDISHQDMADLISFVKNWRYLDGRTPLGK